MKRTVSLKMYLATVVILFIICFASVSFVMSPSEIPISPQSFVSEASYIVGVDGSNTYMKNGETGEIDWDDSDSGAVINACIGNLTSGEIFVKDATYFISTSITLKSGVYLQGESWNTVLKASGSVTSIITASTPVDNVRVANLKLDMNTIADYGINSNDNVISNAVFENLFFNSSKDGAEQCYLSYLQDSEVRYNFFEGNNVCNLGLGLQYTVLRVKIHHNAFHNLDFDGMELRGLHATDYPLIVDIHDNIFYECAGDGIVISGNGKYVTVHHNTFNGTNRGIYVLESPPRAPQYVLVSSNIIVNNGDSGIHLNTVTNVLDSITVVDNQLLTAVTLQIQGSPTNLIIKRNRGFVTENSGTATNSTTTTFVFNHGLAGTPTGVWTSFNTTTINGWAWTATSTQITITVVGSGLPAIMATYWKTEYVP